MALYFHIVSYILLTYRQQNVGHNTITPPRQIRKCGDLETLLTDS